ncbi:hypothetical protein BH10BAC5_BH10BAC5_22420 [soil metagenome]
MEVETLFEQRNGVSQPSSVPNRVWDGEKTLNISLTPDCQPCESRDPFDNIQTSFRRTFSLILFTKLCLVKQLGVETLFRQRNGVSLPSSVPDRVWDGEKKREKERKHYPHSMFPNSRLSSLRKQGSLR